MGEVEEMMCVVCVSGTKRHSGDGCDLASTLCKYDLRKVIIFELGKGAKWEAGKYLFRANVWWSCAQYLLTLVARWLEIIDVCIWRKFAFMSVVVTV